MNRNALQPELHIVSDICNIFEIDEQSLQMRQKLAIQNALHNVCVVAIASYKAGNQNNKSYLQELVSELLCEIGKIPGALNAGEIDDLIEEYIEDLLIAIDD
jgi:hypothetical protein